MTSIQAGATESLNLALIDSVVNKKNDQPGALIAILQEIQAVIGYIPQAAIVRVSELTGVPVADIFGIVTFYAQFRLHPQGKHVVKICHGTACHLNGSEKLSEAVCLCLGAKEGETSANGQYSVEKVACLGCCSLAPTIMIDNETYGRLTSDSIVTVIKEFEASQKATGVE